jgi:hypothetical protein
MDDPFDKDGSISETARIVWETDAYIAEGNMDNSSNKGGRIIILNEDKQVEHPKLLDAYGVEIESEEEPYIPCLDGTHRGTRRVRLLGVPEDSNT